MHNHAIYLASLEGLAGKTTIAISFALLAKGEGMKVGYFKPLGFRSDTRSKESFDEDAVTLKKITGQEDKPEDICPLTFKREALLDDFMGIGISRCGTLIVESYNKVSAGKDLVLIEGAPKLSYGHILGCPAPKLAKDLHAKIIVVTVFRDDSIIDDLLQAEDYCAKCGASISGVVLNKVPEGKMERAKKMIAPFLQEKGIEILGTVPEDTLLSALTVSEIYEEIGGKLLAGKEGMNRIIKAVLVGAMTPESAIRYFQKTKDEIVITGGDRTDIILAALEAGVSGLVLTGNLYPSIKVLPKADDLSVPVILVPDDTYTTLQKIRNIVGKIKPEDHARIDRAKSLVMDNVDWRRILEMWN
ncbi:MAG: phosphotransacetylase family protein [Nitrososphaerota archaeon]|nr:phosphotransacetylase family protein [Nitrososphaerota archaeon]